MRTLSLLFLAACSTTTDTADRDGGLPCVEGHAVFEARAPVVAWETWAGDNLKGPLSWIGSDSGVSVVCDEGQIVFVKEL